MAAGVEIHRDNHRSKFPCKRIKFLWDCDRCSRSNVGWNSRRTAPPPNACFKAGFSRVSPTGAHPALPKQTDRLHSAESHNRQSKAGTRHPGLPGHLPALSAEAAPDIHKPSPRPSRPQGSLFFCFSTHSSASFSASAISSGVINSARSLRAATADARPAVATRFHHLWAFT